MAKKAVDFAKLSLPERPALLKKEDDTVLVEKGVEHIHQRQTATAVAAAKIPRNTPKVSASPTNKKMKISTPTRRNTTADELVEDEMVKKISMDLPVNVYTYLKMRSFRQATTMKEFVLGLIREEMRRIPV